MHVTILSLGVKKEKKEKKRESVRQGGFPLTQMKIEARVEALKATMFNNVPQRLQGTLVLVTCCNRVTLGFGAVFLVG